MSKKIETVAFYAIIILSITVLLFAIYNNNTAKLKEDKLQYIYVNEPFDVQSILADGYEYVEDLNEKEKKYTAIFLVTSDNCSVCMGQFQIYKRFFEEANIEGLFNKIVAVNDSNLARAKWYARINDLKENTIALKNQNLKNILCKYGDSDYEKQLIVINNEKGEIVLRVKVKPGIEIGFEELTKRFKDILSNVI